MIRLNREQILKQQRQVINNAYTHVSYILKECRPFLLGYVQGQFGLLRTDQRLQFQTLAKKNPISGTLIPIHITLSNIGRWIIFPTGPLDIADESVILDIELEDGLTRQQIIPIILREAIVQQSTLDLLSPKLYTLEFAMFKTIESSIKNTLSSVVKNLS